METAFVPLNPRDVRNDSSKAKAAAPIHMPLKLAGEALDLPAADRPLELPNPNSPRDLTPGFREIYLQKREELRKSAEGMEGMLVRQVMKAMRSTIPTPDGEEDDLFGSASHATQMFTQMMDDELSDKIAQNGEFGIANRIFNSHINTLTQEFADQLATGQDRPFGIPLKRR